MIKTNDIFVIDYSELRKFEEKCMIIAKKKLPFTYDRYGYSEEERLNKIFQGEMAQCALRLFFEKESIIFEDYDDIRTDNYEQKDSWDFRIQTTNKKWLELDIKSSMNRYNSKLTYLLNNNFTVPTDQIVKDITVQIFMDDTQKKFFIMGFVEKKDLAIKENIGYLTNIKKPYYKKLIKYGQPISELKKTLGFNKYNSLDLLNFV